MYRYKQFSYILVSVFSLIGIYHVFFVVLSSITGSTLFGGVELRETPNATGVSNISMLKTQTLLASENSNRLQLVADTIPLSKLNKRKLIKNANLSIEVKQVESIVKKIAALAKQYNGYIESSFYNKGSKYSGANANIILRVPADRLTQALSACKHLSLRVLSESISADDITKQYFDLKSQLAHLSMAKSQLNKLLSKATKTQAKLDLYNLLAEKQQAMSLIQSQITYYDNAVSMSKINLSITQPMHIKQKEARSWSVAPVAGIAFQSLLNSLSNLLNYTLYFLIYLLPLVCLWGGIVYIVYRIARTCIQKNRSKHE